MATFTRRTAERGAFLGRASMASPEEQDGPVSGPELERAVRDQQRRQAERRRRIELGLEARCELHMGEPMPCGACGDPA